MGLEQAWLAHQAPCGTAPGTATPPATPSRRRPRWPRAERRPARPSRRVTHAARSPGCCGWAAMKASISAGWLGRPSQGEEIGNAVGAGFHGGRRCGGLRQCPAHDGPAHTIAAGEIRAVGGCISSADPPMSDRPKVPPQYLIPKHAPTRYAGWRATKVEGAKTTALIRNFVAGYRVNMDEAAEPGASRPTRASTTFSPAR